MGRKSNRKKKKHYNHQKNEINSSLQKKSRSKFGKFLRDAAIIAYLGNWIVSFVNLAQADKLSVFVRGLVAIILLLIAIAFYFLLFKKFWPDRRNNQSPKRNKGSSYASSGFIDYSDSDYSSSSDGGGGDCGGGGD